MVGLQSQFRRLELCYPTRLLLEQNDVSACPTPADTARQDPCIFSSTQEEDASSLLSGRDNFESRRCISLWLLFRNRGGFSLLLRILLACGLIYADKQYSGYGLSGYQILLPC
jgi:hypothetical protein